MPGTFHAAALYGPLAPLQACFSSAALAAIRAPQGHALRKKASVSPRQGTCVRLPSERQSRIWAGVANAQGRRHAVSSRTSFHGLRPRRRPRQPLLELTDKRAKPAVFFGGKCRIIDFALSNALNSGVRRIAVATQYKAHSLIRAYAARMELPPSGAERELRHPSREPARLGADVVRGNGRCGIPEYRHHSKLRPGAHRHPGGRSHLQDGL